MKATLTNRVIHQSLPDGWAVLPLKDAVTKLVDGSHNPPKKCDSGRPMLSARNIENNQIIFDKFRYISDEDFKSEQARTRLSPGDVLLTIVGTIGRSACMPTGIEDFTLQRSVAVMTPKAVLSKYLMYQLQAPTVQRYFEENARGTAQKGVYLKTLSQTPIRVAPVDQQEEIVAEIEKQFSRLEEAVTSLKRAKANLKRYRAAVLKAAVEGKLTEEWRKQHPDVEPASELLKRILAERRRKWEDAEIAKMHANGKEPKNENWKAKYKEPLKIDIDNLPSIPNGWTWASFEQLAAQETNALKAGPFGSSLKKAFYVSQGYKIYGQEQVLRNDPHYGDYYIDEDRYVNLKACAVKSGDILISLVGTIGKIMILPEGIEPGIINPRLVKLSLDSHLINSNYIKVYLQSPFVKYLFSLASHGGTMDILNLTILKELPIPVPPLSEQQFIIGEVDRVTSIIEGFDNYIETDARLSGHLRNSVLKRAFAGHLLINSN